MFQSMVQLPAPTYNYDNYEASWQLNNDNLDKCLDWLFTIIGAISDGLNNIQKP